MTERISYVEVDLRRCSNTYSNSPCFASLGVTGDKKCFNSFATCQDKNNFTDEVATVRYSTVTAYPPLSIDAIPSISTIGIRPAKLELGESIGIRASVTISFKDHRGPDTGPDGDRYLADRNYDPYTQGTYWGKFRARYPFVRGSKIRIIRGTTDQSVEQMETRHFIIENVAGPDSNGTFTIKAKDALNLAKGKQAQAPSLSSGTTTFGLSDSATNLLLAPTGVGNLEYPSTGLLNIGGKELCTFTRSGDNVTIVRGTNNTEAISHSAGVRIQLCVQFSVKKVTSIIRDLLEGYASIDTTLIPIVDWTTESDTYIDRNYSGIIAEPTAVDKLINELLAQTASSLWWDDINQLIQFRVLRAVNSDAALYSDDLINANTFSAKDQPNKRVSQVWTYYGQINPLEKLDEATNYSTTIVTVSPESEADFDGEKSIKTIFSRWIPLGSDAAERLNLLILSRYSTPPRLISFGLQKDANLVAPELGGGYNCQNFTLQDDEGFSSIVPIQLLQVKSTDGNFAVIGEEVLYSQTIIPEDPTIKNITITNDDSNLNLYDYAISGGFTFNTGDTVNFFVYSGVIISSSTLAAALITGSGWPAGIALNMENNGQIIGKAGDGGAGGNASVDGSGFNAIASDGGAGTDGGRAIELEYELNVTNNGVIGGGGGGGGGGSGDYKADPDDSLNNVTGGGGGGGGAGGSIGGSGGDAVVNGFPDSTSSVDGHAGQGGSLTIRGEGGNGGTKGGPVKVSTGGKGGDGGSIGVDGIDGVGTSSTEPPVSKSGGMGGTAGLGVLTNGNTLNLTGNAVLGGVI